MVPGYLFFGQLTHSAFSLAFSERSILVSHANPETIESIWGSLVGKLLGKGLP